MRKLYKPFFAILIIISMISVACSSSDLNKDSLKKSDKTPVKTVGGTVTLEPLFYSEGPSGPSGGSSKMEIELRETKSDNITVAISDDEVGGSGDQWEASAWNAMTVSTLVTGASLDKRQFQVNATGFIDGPSAGALMTVGAISLIRGEKIDEDVTMTGTINPDGTVGPVGGIEYKLEGAQKAGKEKVLIPAGQLREPDASGDIVDLKEIGKDLGLEVIEVANVYEAYEEFTGKSLPKLEGNTDIKLTSNQSNQLEDVVNDYIDKVSDIQKTFSEPAIAATIAANGFDSTVSDIDTTIEDVESYLDDEMYAAAIARVREAYGYALSVKWGIELSDELAFGGNEAAITVIDDLDKELNNSFEDFKDELSDLEVKTLGDAEMLVDSYSILTVVKSLELSGVNMISTSFDENNILLVSQEEFNFILGKSAATIAAALAGLEIQADVIDGIDSGDTPDIEDDLDVATIAKFFRQGADSNLEAFRTVIVQEVIDSAKVDESGAFEILSRVDSSIETAFNSGEVERNAEEIFGNNDNLPYAQLGAAVELYARSSELMAKYYSLGVPDVVDGSIEIVDFRSEKAFESASELATDQLNGVYSVLDEQGFSSYTMVDENELASIEDTSDPTSAIRGLRHYWKGYILGRVFSYIGGFPRKGLN